MNSPVIIPDGTPPDIVVKYNLETSNVKVIRGKTVNEIFSSILFDQDNKQIGTRSLLAEVLNTTNPENIIKNEYPISATCTLFLPEGNIKYNANYEKIVFNPTINAYVYPPISEIISPIINGTEKYINIKGFVVTLVSTDLRQIQVYIEK